MKSNMTQLMLSGKSLLRFAFILSSLFFFSTQDAKASHIVGGDLTYRCIGNNLYEIRLTIRRDCFFGDTAAYFDDPASVGFFDGITNQLLSFIGVSGQLKLNYNADDTLNEILISDCSVISGDVCVHTTQYVDTIFLPFRASGYTMAYQRCCRNETLNNITNPDATGMTLVAELSGFAQQACNSSPQFGPYPPIYTCVNKDINFSHAAFDIEGDSLVYSLCTPFAGGTQSANRPQPPPSPPYPLVVFQSPYSLGNLMGGVPLAIDPNTGVITGAPNTIGQFVIGICVTAYQNGVMTGTTRRDFQYNVRMCRDVPVANFSAPQLDCEDLTVVFDNQSILSDEFLWIFDYGNPLSDTSPAFEPTYTYTQEGFYNVALIVNDSNEFCFDTIVHQIGVFDSQINANFTHAVSSCTDDIVLDITDTSFDPSPGHDIVSWQWLVTACGSVMPDTGQSPQFIFTADDGCTVVVSLLVTSSNGCTATRSKTFDVQQINIPFNPASDSICNGESVSLLLGGDDSLIYTWSPAVTGPDHNPVVSPTVTTVYSVTVTDGLCEVTGQTTVNVQQLPVLAFDYETDCKSLLVEFDNNSTGAFEVEWNFGVIPVQTDPTFNPTFTFPAPGIYTVTLSSKDGCDVSVSRLVTVDAIAETFDDQEISCFSEPVSLNPDIVGNYLYEWSIDTLSGANPTITVQSTTEIFVTVTSPGRPDCHIVDSITVLVPPSFEPVAPTDIITCQLAEIDLVASVTGGATVGFIWTNSDGDTLSNVALLTVTPTETDTFCFEAKDFFGCTKTACTIISRPDATFDVMAPADTAYCNVQAIPITASATVPVTFQWFNLGDPDVIGQDSILPAAPGVPSCFLVIGTEALGCQESDTVCLTPTFMDISITGGQSICLEENVTLVVTNNIAGQNVSFIWTPQVSVNDTIVVSPTVTTTYTVFVTDTEVGCTAEASSTVTVNLFDPLDVVITADDDTITLTEDIQLFVNQPSNFGYVWTSNIPVKDGVIPPVQNPTVTPLEPGNITFTVTVTNEHGCTEVASLTINVEDPFCDMRDIGVPNIFSPNGDGQNDILYVLANSNVITTLDFHIYNRWGERVFHSNDQTMGWNGKYKDERLPPDVFGYYLEISCPNGKTFFKKGNITLLE